MEAIALATQDLKQADKDWYINTLHRELAQLGNLKRFEAAIAGTGVII